MAPADDPTRTAWIHVDGDPAVTRARIRRVLRLGGDQEAIVISAWGFGQHCGWAHRVDLDLICAIQAVAAEHATTVGN